MKPLTIYLALQAILVLSQPSLAGPNAGGQLLIYESDLIYSAGTTYCESEVVSCSGAVTRADHMDPVVLTVVASFENVPSPRLSGLSFGLAYEEDDIVILDFGHCANFELHSDTWPASGSGTALAFNDAREDVRSVVSWFVAYSYTGEPAVLALAEHPTQGAWFADDSNPAVLDPINALGSFGFYTDGGCPLPQGACCLPSSTCIIISEERCTDGGGTFAGIGSTCAGSACLFTEDWLWELLDANGSSPVEVFCFLSPDSIYALVDSSYIVSARASGAVVSIGRAAAESLLVGGAQLAKVVGEEVNPAGETELLYTTTFYDKQVPRPDEYNSEDLEGEKPFWGTEYGFPGIHAAYWNSDGEGPCLCEESYMHTIMDNTPTRGGAGIDLSHLSYAIVTFLIHGSFPLPPDNGRLEIRVDDGPEFDEPGIRLPSGDLEGPWVISFPIFNPDRVYWRAELLRDYIGSSDPIVITAMSIEGTVENDLPDLVATVSNVHKRFDDHWIIDFDAKISRVNSVGEVTGPVRLGFVRRVGYGQFDPAAFNSGMVDLHVDFTETEVEFGTPKQVSLEFGGGENPAVDSENFWAIADPDRWVIESDEAQGFPECGGVCENNVFRQYYAWPLPQLPVVFVHGFLGSKISKNYASGNQTVWSDNLLIMGKTLLQQPDKLRKERESPLQREYDDPSRTATATGFIDGVSIGSVSSVLRAVRIPGNLYPYESNWVLPTITAFPIWTGMRNVSSWNNYNVIYDFRSSLQGEAFTDIAQAIAMAKQQNPGASKRVAVVSHSLGSLAVQGFIRNERDQGRDPGIRSWISLGGPFEGTSHVYGALFGTNAFGLGWHPIVNHVVASSGRKIAEACAGAYSALPVEGHEHRPIYGRLEDCDPYCEVFWKDVANGTIDTQWERTWDDVRVGFVPSGGLPTDWYLDSQALNFSAQLWDLPTTEEMPERIARVMSDSRPTVSGVYWMAASGQYPYPEPIRLYIAVPGEAGDGAVEHFSAIGGDVPSSVTNFYIDEEHRKLPNNTYVAQAMTRWAKGDTHNPLPYQVTGTAPGITRSPLLIEVRVLKSTVVDDGDAALETPFPIGIELVDHSTGTPQFLVANVLTEGSGDGIVQNVCFGDGITAYGAERQLFLLVDPGPYSRKLSLILTPDPLFWTPYDPPVASQGFIADDATFDVRCQVLLHDDNTVWSFPGEREGGEPISFTNVWDGSGNDPRGFAARADFWLHNTGDIDGIEDPGRITLTYDGDADGAPEGEVSGINGPGWDSSSWPKGFISPNPFSNFTRLFWGDLTGPARLRVFDSSGRLVAQEQVVPDQSGIIEIDSDILRDAHGVMFFHLEQDGKSSVIKGIRLLR